MNQPDLVVGTNRWRGTVALELQQRVQAEKCWLDTAETYGLGASERSIGRWGADLPVATKIMPWWWRQPQDLDQYRVHSQNRLKCTTLDLLFLHFPPRRDMNMWLRALAAQVNRGHARAIGVCNFNLAQLQAAVPVLKAAGVPLTAVQAEVSLLQSECLYTGLRDYCRTEGIALWGFRALGDGALTSTHSKQMLHWPARSTSSKKAWKLLRVRQALTHVANHTGQAPETVALAWLRHHGVTPMVGVRSAKHLEAAIASRMLKLSPQLMMLLNAASAIGVQGKKVEVLSSAAPRSKLHVMVRSTTSIQRAPGPSR